MYFRSIFLICVFAAFSLFGSGDISPWGNYKTTNEEEALFLRRIADFWQEGEYGIAKKQIEEFLEAFPLSAFSPPLSASMADLLLREKNYVGALNYYSKITSADLLEKTFLNRMQCLYYLEWYATLADECEAYLKNSPAPDLALKTTYYLAIALYRQCLNEAQNEDVSVHLAKRAEPYFETLLNSALSKETAQAFAHLCCILKQFPKAATIYADLAKQDPETEEEMLFQAALIQSEFDKKEALETFKIISEKKGEKSREASYNQMILLLESSQYEEILALKETFLKDIPQDKKGMASLFFGKCYLALKKYSQAAIELKNFIQETPTHHALESAFISLIEASFQSNDLNGINLALNKLSALNPNHPEISKGRFSRALLLKKLGDRQQCKIELTQLLTDCPQFPLRSQTIFELTHMEYQENRWESCRSYSKTFISEFPNSELTPFVWRYFVSSSAAIATENIEKPEFKERLILDIAAFLKQEDMFSQEERNDWQFFLSKAHFDLKHFQEASLFLSPLLQETSFPQQANAYLLLALCSRDENQNLESFCSLAETALEKKANLMQETSIHTALFNAYLTLSEKTPELIHSAAEHLYLAFEKQASISFDNLVWLASFYEKQFKKDPIYLNFAKKTCKIYESILLSNNLKNENSTQDESNLKNLMPRCMYKLCKFYSLLGEREKEIILLKELIKNYPDSKYKEKGQFLLAEAHAAMGNKKIAAALYDSLAKAAPPIRSKLSAKAHLSKARLWFSTILKKELPLDHPKTIEILANLKDLILQKNLLNEPIHLEAAFEYANFKTKIGLQEPEKKIALLQGLKRGFENKEDLLSQDYHRAREKYPEKERIYLGYMQLLDAEILLAQAELYPSISEQNQLQVKGEDLLLEIIREQAHPALVSRATSRLQERDVDTSKN